jgi:hypothetical protein
VRWAQPSARFGPNSKNWNWKRYDASALQAYLMIKPLAPDTGGEFAEKVAGHVRGALDDLGMLVRLD